MTDDQKAAARRVRDAFDAVNDAIADAASVGVETRYDTVELQEMGDRFPTIVFSARTSVDTDESSQAA